MITCPKCKKELSDDAKFCDVCGAKVLETFFCPNCGEQTSTEFAFCQNCGASINNNPHEEQAVVVPAEKKKLPKKAIIFGAIGVTVVAALILVITLLFGGAGKSDNNYALYLKDREIFFNDLKKDSNAWQLTSRLVDNDRTDEEDLAEAGYQLGLFTYMSKDGKYVFFPDKIGNNDDGFNLYYKEVAEPEKEAVKIDSDIRSYAVNDSTTLVTYTKGNERNLYQYKIGENSKDKIASGVYNFYVSDDGKKICYLNSDNNIYLKYADKDKEKIASDVSSSLLRITEGFSAVYYLKDDSLYKRVEGADPEKIASDVSSVIRIYDSGEIYYLTGETKEIPLIDYVTDDMKDVDDAIPTRPTPPSSSDYASSAEFNAAYDAYEEEYEAWEADYNRRYEEHYAKQYRDRLREELEEETLNQFTYSLHFYDGKKETVITNVFVGGYDSDYSYASKAPVLSYEAYNQSDFNKVKLSEVESIYDIKDKVETALFSSTERYIAVKGTATAVEQEKKAVNFTIDSSGTVVYYFDDIPDGNMHGELRRIAINDGVVGKSEVYDNDVYTDYLYFVNDTELAYFKDCKNSKGELYINKKKIDDDVNYYSIEIDSDLDRIFYFTDWNSDKHYGTLKVYNGKETMKIADDVDSFSAIPDGRVLYLSDYSRKYYMGVLYEWKNGKIRKIDDDVVCILPLIDSKYRSYYYSW